MEKLREKIFTKEMTVRNLIMAGIMVLLFAWDYVSVALLSGDWNWFAIDFYSGEQVMGTIGLVGVTLLVNTILAFCVYWNARIWMLPCLLKSVLYLLGAIPIVNRLIPESVRSGWFDSISAVAEPAYEGYWHYDPDFGWEYDDGRLPFFIAIPLGIIGAVLKGVFKSVINLIAAIGIPFLSPILMLLGLAGIMALLPAAGGFMAAGVVCLAIVVFVYIVIPVVTFRGKDRTGIRTGNRAVGENREL